MNVKSVVFKRKWILSENDQKYVINNFNIKDSIMGKLTIDKEVFEDVLNRLIENPFHNSIKFEADFKSNEIDFSEAAVYLKFRWFGGIRDWVYTSYKILEEYEKDKILLCEVVR